MKKNAINFHQSIFIYKPREVVWDFTQNYENRMQWDKSITEATILENQPNRTVRLKVRGKTTMTFVYKLDERPHKNSLSTMEVQSALIESGCGY